MERLIRLLGHERDVDETARALYGFASDLRAPVVGAMHVTCADESEREVIEAFQRNFSEPLLPNLKFGERAHFRIANLGARYEAGALRIADDHFSTRAAQQSWKLLLVKVNAHVCVEQTADGPRFGRTRRYDAESLYCGALHALLDGSKLPFAEDLGRALRMDGKDRIAALQDPRQVEPRWRSLFAAVISACMQARSVVADLGGDRLGSPTLLVVVPCVTLNRKSKDTEMLCGVHHVDLRGEVARREYRGLGDDPSAYRCGGPTGALVVD